MIGKLRGVVDTVEEGSVLVDVGGVFYECHCSGRTLAGLPAPGRETTIFIETYVREDQLKLFGFGTLAEKLWFLSLMTVQGVGAKVALAILSTLPVSELSSALALQDKAMIGRAPGVGPKVAQRIVTELRGKAPEVDDIGAGVRGLQEAIGDGVASGSIADAVSALTNLGYSQTQVSATLARIVATEKGEPSTETLIRLGLKELGS